MSRIQENMTEVLKVLLRVINVVFDKFEWDLVRTKRLSRIYENLL